MALDKSKVTKVANILGYSVYGITIIFGGYLIVADPSTLTATKPSLIQISGLILIAYGIIEIAVTMYNRLPPKQPKTAEQIAKDKSRLRERNDQKSKERSIKK